MVRRQFIQVIAAGRMLFTDGLTGILIFIGVYAAGAMGWGTLQLLAYGLILSSFSVVGGLLAGSLDGRLRPKKAFTLEIIGVSVSQLLLLGNNRSSLFLPALQSGHSCTALE